MELKASPRVAGKERPISLFKKIDAAMCNAGVVKVIVGNHFYRFQSTTSMAAGRALPEQHRVSLEVFGCDHRDACLTGLSGESHICNTMRQDAGGNELLSFTARQ